MSPALNAEQSDGSSTKDSFPKLPPKSSPLATPIPSFPDNTSVSQVPWLPYRAWKQPALTCV